jgi:oxygen-independent coproporphyrinogen-3 oxidase
MKNSLSIYIHWPFCLAKCPYCDFNSHVANSFDHDAFEKAYLKELAYYKDIISGKYIKSIFFGGGTPSLMAPNVVKNIIQKIKDLSIVNDKTEITLEANPTSIEYKKFEAFRKAGINRISVGIQALSDKDLKALGRKHSAREAVEALKIAKDVFDNYSFDLIYTREGQDLASWKDELYMALELAGNHISLYQLVIEKATPFYNLHRDGKLILPSNDISADMYEYSLDCLRSKGFERYEVSNYAKPGFECKHNLTYWNYQDYLGIGPGAHSRLFTNDKVSALMNFHKPDKWMSAVEEKGIGLQNTTQLNNNEILEELLMMNLRLEEGLDIKKMKDFFGKDVKNMLNISELKKFVDAGMVKYDDDRIRLTDKGMMMHSYIVPRLCV